MPDGMSIFLSKEQQIIPLSCLQKSYSCGTLPDYMFNFSKGEVLL